MIQSRTNTDCFPWYCHACKISGVVTVSEPSMPGEISGAILVKHGEESPRCSIAEIRIVSAENWYGTILPKKEGI